MNRKKFRIRLPILTWLVSSAMVMLLVHPAFAAPIGQATNSQETTTNLWPVLAPLLTASIGVERAVEILWNYIEWFLLNLRRWKVEALRSPEYVQFKSGTSLVFAIVLGILVAHFTNMRLFLFLQPLAPSFLAGVPSTWDVVVTGLLIGSGAKPVHDLLGILSQIKNFLGNAAIQRREEAAKALAEGVLRLAQSETQSMIDVPGIGPTRLSPLGGARGMNGNGDATTESERETIQHYVEILRNATSK